MSDLWDFNSPKIPIRYKITFKTDHINAAKQNLPLFRLLASFL
jgi:hypothetical protein